jgi:cell wall-associated NlpC family hydrolase
VQYAQYPYEFGGSSPEGFDCSGFVYFVFRQSGTPISRDIYGQYAAGSHPDRNDLQAGDLVFFANTYMAGLSHVGIYMGNDQFIHAADETSGVAISNLRSDYWTAHWFGATRVR